MREKDCERLMREALQPRWIEFKESAEIASLLDTSGLPYGLSSLIGAVMLRGVFLLFLEKLQSESLMN